MNETIATQPILVTMDFSSLYGGFRENYPFEEEGQAPRHWMLDHWIGRLVLKSKAIDLRPDILDHFWKNDEASDQILNAVIDQLGLREVTPPQGWRETYSTLLKI